MWKVSSNFLSTVSVASSPLEKKHLTPLGMGGPPTAGKLGKLLWEEWGSLTLALSGPGHSTALKGRPSTVLPQAVGAFTQPGGRTFPFLILSFLSPFGNWFLLASLNSLYSLYSVYSLFFLSLFFLKIFTPDWQGS